MQKPVLYANTVHDVTSIMTLPSFIWSLIAAVHVELQTVLYFPDYAKMYNN